MTEETKKGLAYILCCICVVTALFAILICTCPKDSVEAKAEADETAPISVRDWKEHVPGVLGTLNVVALSDGHDYIVGTHGYSAITITHAAGCRRCNSIGYKAPPPPLPSSFN